MSSPNQKNSKAVTKYLDRYSALSIEANQTLKSALKTQYHQAIVIPAYNETTDFVHRFSKLLSSGDNGTDKTLLIIVANCPAYCDEESVNTTQRFINHLNAQQTNENVMKGVSFGHIHSSLDLLLLDLTLEEPPLVKGGTVESGVGFARKVGMDTALLLKSNGIIQSPWIYSSDADAFWTPDYLAFNKIEFRNKGAIVLSFNHQQAETNTLLSDAAALYDISLRYYVLGLRWANSPWAYHTVGSTLLIHAESYAETRGFPIREAGEDFYLLNKVAKTGNIYCPQEPHIHLSDRPSQRVPFGTGPAVNRISGQENPDKEFFLYHPDCFVLLKHWQQLIPGLFETDLSVIQETPIAGLSSEFSENVLRKSLWQGLQQLGLPIALNHALKQSKSSQQFSQHLWQWFDGFRTLKLIHWLRDNSLPSLCYQDWKQLFTEQKIPFIQHDKQAATSSYSISKQLEQLEKNTLPFQGGLH